MGQWRWFADHTPFPKVVEDLALAFGFEFSNGHVGPFVFRASAGEGEGTLLEHVIAGFQQSLANEVMMPLPALLGEANTSAFKPITQVKTFGGSAFKAPKEAAVLLRLDGGAMSVEPEVPFQVTSATPRVAMQGWSQGAVLKVGKGRVAVFAEGMMFSSQLDTKAGAKFGFTSAGAEQNERFLLNVMHWLSGLN